MYLEEAMAYLMQYQDIRRKWLRKTVFCKYQGNIKIGCKEV
jgi:hypothetical protein